MNGFTTHAPRSLAVLGVHCGPCPHLTEDGLVLITEDLQERFFTFRDEIDQTLGLGFGGEVDELYLTIEPYGAFLTATADGVTYTQPVHGSDKVRKAAIAGGAVLSLWFSIFESMN